MYTSRQFSNGVIYPKGFRRNFMLFHKISMLQGYNPKRSTLCVFIVTLLLNIKKCNIILLLFILTTTCLYSLKRKMAWNHKYHNYEFCRVRSLSPVHEIINIFPELCKITNMGQGSEPSISVQMFCLTAIYLLTIHLIPQSTHSRTKQLWFSNTSCITKRKYDCVSLLVM